MSHMKIWSKDFILLFIINNVLFFCFQMLTPNIPGYTAELGAAGGVIGLVTSSFAAAAFLVRPFAGSASDRFNKNLIQRVSLGALTLTLFSYALARNLPMLLVIRFLHGFLFGINQTATSTILSHVLPHYKMAAGFSIFSTGTIISMGIAPAAGLWIVESQGYPRLFFTSGVISLIAFAFTFFIKGQHTGYSGEPSIISAGADYFAKEAAAPAAITLLNTFAFAAVSTFLILHGEARDIPNVGFFYTVFAVTLLVVRLIAGSVVDQLPSKLILYPCSILICAAMIFLWGANSMSHLIAAAITYGISSGFTQPVLQAMAIRSVSLDRRGVASGTYYMGMDLGNSIGPIVAGMVASSYGYGAAFLSMILPVCLGMLIMIFAGQHIHPHHQPVPASIAQARSR